MSDLAEALRFQADGIEAGPHEDQYLSRFGSHFSLRFHPAGRGVLPVGLGPINADACTYLALELDGQSWVLPLQYPQVFCRGERGVLAYELSRTMNTLTLRSREEHPQASIEWEFVSPFFPGDSVVSTAPFFYITCRVRNLRDTPVRIVARAGLEMECRRLCTDGLPGVARRLDVAAAFRGPETRPGRLLRYEIALLGPGPGSVLEMHETSVAYWECLAHSLLLAPGEQAAIPFILAEYLLDESIVSRHGSPCRFAYQRTFASAEEVLRFACRERRSILEKSGRFDSLVADTTLPPHIRSFVAWNFHIFLGATWLLADPDGRLFYTCYEGGAAYFSTVDLEYNLAPFYALFWPRLLADQLDLWAETYAQGNRRRPHAAGPEHGIMEHDVGGGFTIDEQAYIQGPMPVEENADYILMHWLYHRFTGDMDRFRAHAEVCRGLAAFIISYDTNGNGLPDRGTSNTLDCFEPLLRDMGDQVYLGVKAAAALDALAELLSASGAGGAGRYRQHAGAIIAAVEREAWRTDHYAITIAAARPEGWDRGTPLTSNGLLYFLLAGREPQLDARRLRTDICATADDYTIWPSMGVWRDLAGCYLGLAPQGHYHFRPDFRGDTYPRSFNAVAFLLAWAGIGTDVVDGRVTVRNPRDGRFPLLPFADWRKGTVPWLVIEKGVARLEGDGTAVRAIVQRPLVPSRDERTPPSERPNES